MDARDGPPPVVVLEERGAPLRKLGPRLAAHLVVLEVAEAVVHEGVLGEALREEALRAAVVVDGGHLLGERIRSGLGLGLGSGLDLGLGLGLGLGFGLGLRFHSWRLVESGLSKSLICSLYSSR